MPAGTVRKFVDGSDRVDGRAFAFIQPDDGSADVFAPVRTFAGNSKKMTDLEGQKVTYELKPDDMSGKSPMAASWKVLDDGDARKSSRSRSGSSRRSRSGSRRSRRRSRSRRSPSRSRRSRSRSRSRRPRSQAKSRSRTRGTYKVTICDIPPSMSNKELKELARAQGRSSLAAHTYRKGHRHCGLVEYADKADADNCIAELDYRRVEGSDLRLRCVAGAVHDEGERGDDREKQQARRDTPPQRGGRTPPPSGPGTGISQFVRPGDWECPTCGMNVFASKDQCFKCGTPKNGGSTRWGDGWKTEKATEQSGGDRRGDPRVEEAMTVYVPNLPENIEEDEVREDFERSCARATILRVMIKRGEVTSGFVRFSAAKYARRAIEDAKDGDIKVRGAPIEAEMSRTNTSVES